MGTIDEHGLYTVSHVDSVDICVLAGAWWPSGATHFQAYWSYEDGSDTAQPVSGRWHLGGGCENLPEVSGDTVYFWVRFAADRNGLREGPLNGDRVDGGSTILSHGNLGGLGDPIGEIVVVCEGEDGFIKTQCEGRDIDGVIAIGTD